MNIVQNTLFDYGCQPPRDHVKLVTRAVETNPDVFVERKKAISPQNNYTGSFGRYRHRWQACDEKPVRQCGGHASRPNAVVYGPNSSGGQQFDRTRVLRDLAVVGLFLVLDQ